MAKNNNGLLRNLSWKFAERISAQVVTLVVSIVLARLLDPSHYGLISIVNIFITLANVFVSDGFGSALIQKKDSDVLDFSSVLYFNICFSLVLYGILWISAPYISSFYGDGYELLTPVLRVLSLRLILSAINSVQQAYISKNMMFEKFFWATLFGTIVSAFVGIYMAYKGYGVWALVAQYMTNTTIDTIVLQISINKWPVLRFSFERLKQLLGFGARILGSNLLITGYQELRALIIGKVYSSEDLAFYDKGKQFPSIIVTNINTSIGAVLFPKMSQLQDSKDDVKLLTRKSIRFGSYCMCPIMLGLAAVSRPVVSILLTDKWLPCVPLMQLLCINSMCLPFHTANMQATKAMGRSDITFKTEIIKKSIELVVLISVMRISVTAIVIGMAACSVSFVFLNGYPNIKLIDYSLKEQLNDLLPNLVMSSIMAALVMLIGMANINQYLLVIIQVIVGALFYVLLSVVTRNKEFKYIYRLVFKRY